MPQHAEGPFVVKRTPHDATDGAAYARSRLDKTFEGDLAATSIGEMLAFMNAAEGAGGYVAMEQVQGTLHGKVGTFLLQHLGTMTKQGQSLVLTVIPGSATGALAGLSGTMRIDIASGGAHRYAFDYTLP
jgi:hypothetical protein